MSLCDQCKRADNSCPIWHPCNDTEDCVEYIPNIEEVPNNELSEVWQLEEKDL